MSGERDSYEQLDRTQCGQIRQNFYTLAKFKQSLVMAYLVVDKIMNILW